MPCTQAPPVSRLSAGREGREAYAEAFEERNRPRCLPRTGAYRNGLGVPRGLSIKGRQPPERSCRRALCLGRALQQEAVAGKQCSRRAEGVGVGVLHTLKDDRAHELFHDRGGRFILREAQGCVCAGDPEACGAVVEEDSDGGLEKEVGAEVEAGEDEVKVERQRLRASSR